MESLAEATGWLFGWLLRNSAHASLLAAIVFTLELCFWRRLSPRWRYGLWLLVLARLLLPVAPESRVSLFNLVDLAPAGISGAVLEVLGLPTPAAIPAIEPTSPLADTPHWFVVALALWFPGAVVLAGLIWRDHRRLKRALDHTAPVQGHFIQDLLTQSKGVMAVTRLVEVVESAEVTSPAICGWWRPRLLLPHGLLRRLTPDETRFLFLHELAHVKRSDIAFNWLLAAIQVLHWFNPIIWLALRRVLAVREEVCDDLVLRRSFPGAKREYGLTLLRILEECAPKRIVPALAGVLDDVRSLRRRIRCIREFTRCEANPWTPALFTVTFAVAGLTERIPEPWTWQASLQTASTHSEQPPTRTRSTGGSNRGRSTPPTRPAAPKNQVLPAIEEVEFGPPAPGTQERMIVALREAAQRFGENPANPGSGVSSVRNGGASAPTPGAPTTRAAATVTLARMSSSSPSTAPTRSPGRIYPLPPVSERGDILRPRRSANTSTSVATSTVPPPTSRSPVGVVANASVSEPVPAVGRVVFVPGAQNTRRD